MFSKIKKKNFFWPKNQKINFSSFFDKKLLNQKKFFGPNFFFDVPRPALLTVTGPIFFYQIIIFDQNIYFTKKLFWPKNFLGPKNYIWPNNYFRPTFCFEQTFCLSKKLFWPKQSPCNFSFLVASTTTKCGSLRPHGVSVRLYECRGSNHSVLWASPALKVT